MDQGREFSRLIAIELVSEGRRLGVAQKEIATSIGVGEAQMSLYTKGKRGSVTVPHLMQACERLGIAPQTIVSRAYEALLFADPDLRGIPTHLDLAASMSDHPTDRERFDQTHPDDGYA